MSAQVVAKGATARVPYPHHAVDTSNGFEHPVRAERETCDWHVRRSRGENAMRSTIARSPEPHARVAGGRGHFAAIRAEANAKRGVVVPALLGHQGACVRRNNHVHPFARDREQPAVGT